MRDRSGVQMLPRKQRHNRGHPDISLDMLQEACALVSTSTRPQQRESVMAHFYAMHFAPLLVEAACGPPVDITAHHQVCLRVGERSGVSDAHGAPPGMFAGGRAKWRE